MKFPLKCNSYVDKNNFRINFSIWDKDLLSYNDYLSDQTLNIWPTVKTCITNGERAKFIGKDENGNNSDKFIIETIANPNIPFSKNSEILASIEIVPQDDAEMAPVGFGRGDPNQDPYLPPPIGRWKFSMNPWTLFVSFYLI